MEIQFDENSMPDGQPKMKSAFGKSCNDFKQNAHKSKNCYWKNQIKMDDLLHLFMMNQATPRLGAWSDFEKKKKEAKIIADIP